MKVQWLFVILQLVPYGLPGHAQSASAPFTFKGNHMGMSLADFKAQNAGGTVWVNTGKPNIFGRQNKKLSQQVAVPLCTDLMRGFPGDEEGASLPPGEVICNPSPGVANPEGRTVAGILVQQLLYKFHDDKLYAIQMRFRAVDYGSIAAAFKEKYGTPTFVKSENYQNGFGAVWKGEHLIWRSPSEVVSVIEGSGNGPAQDPMSVDSFAEIEDVTLLPSSPPKDYLDF